MTRHQPSLIKLLTPSDIHILVAEDNPVNQRVVKHMLARIGYSVDVVENGQEACTATASKSYHLVLMDMMMPVMDGLEATRRIRSQEGNSSVRTPIVALTANADRSDEKRCVEAGMDAFISKPFTLEQLKSRISYFVFGQANGSFPIEKKPLRVLDESVLSTFVKTMGEDDLPFIQELFSDFLVEANRVRTVIHAAVTSKSSIEIAQAAHSLRGSASVFGAEQVIAACLELENLAKNSQFDDISLRLSSFEGSLNAVRAELDVYFNRLETLSTSR